VDKVHYRAESNGFGSPARGRKAKKRADATELRLGRLSDALGFNLRLAQEASFRAFAHRVGDPDLKPRRYAMLQLIDQNPGLTQAELGRASGRDKSSITPALRDLSRRGLVKRSAVAYDRRVYTLRLTPKGRLLLRKLTGAAKEHDRMIAAGIGSENRAKFLSLLRAVTGAAQNSLK
jgi:DNA-binding MarR family transcriptional regulator